ncbi:MAG: hypothetical protein A2X36_06905 [Elusimicrobia bacterium GWA2_69_24]|nr:MAG: hypothetical protein A2X36_06905 [Elusimicrobia bacterium GWA2_69_24]HBL17230.1 hypothetical protein [Elusimicrobiota bacterium]
MTEHRPGQGLRQALSRAAGSDMAAVWALLVLGIGLYAGTLFYLPVWDDHGFVFGQPFLMECGNLASVLAPKHFLWVLPVKNAARPAWLASVLADTCVYGGQVPGYRMTSILLHAVGAAMMLPLAWRFSRSRFAAVAAGLLFVCHPLHTESVNIITFRTDVLALVFMVPALLLYLDARAERGRRRVLGLAAAAGLYALAMLSKEMAVVLPALMLAADLLRPPGRPPSPVGGGRRRWTGWRIYAAFAAVLLLFLWFRTPRSGYVMAEHMDLFSEWRAKTVWLRAPVSPEFASQATLDIGTEIPPWRRIYEEPWTRLFTMSEVLGSYLKLFLWPHPLQGDYSPALVDSPGGGVWLAWLGWGALLLAAWTLRRRSPLIAFGAAWMAVSLVPVSGAFTLLNPQAERYLYIPSAGACLLLAGLLQELRLRPWRRARALGLALAGGLAVAYGSLTVLRNGDYSDEERFYAATVRVDPSVGRAHLNLAGLHLLSGSPEQTEAEYRDALSHWPESLRGRNKYALFLATQGRHLEAIAQLRAALKLSARNPWLRMNLGIEYQETGRQDLALKEFRAVMEEAPRFQEAPLAAGLTLLGLGRPGEAVPCLERAAALSGWKNPSPLYYLVLAHRRAGDRREADRVLAVLRRTAPELVGRLERER